jgi:glycosyltransferase involved in cell wall biosynthesis
MTSSVLMIALEFPPCHSAGVQRTLSFVKHLPRHGWQPVVLTASPRAYRHRDETTMAELPQGLEVARAFALDSSRQLAVGGRYLACTASPDRYVSWFLPAVAEGARLIRRHRPRAIWSTYPVATAHWVAAMLSRRSGLPWIADFRDPAQFHYDPGAAVSRRARKIDMTTARHASTIVFTTDKARELYLEQYKGLAPERTVVIPNGYDGASFKPAVQGDKPAESGSKDVLVLHSGALYGEGRDPAALVQAVAILGPRLAAEGRRLILRFRGANPSSAQRELVRRSGAEPYVEFAPRVSFDEAREEMACASVLVLIQSALFDLQVPGKAYEYIATRRPIIALTGRDGATAALLREVESAVAVDDRDVEGIVAALSEALAMPTRSGDLGCYDRAVGSAQLVDVLAGSTAPGGRAQHA